MDLMLFVEVLSDIVLRFLMLYGIYGALKGFQKQELLVMAVALTIEAVLLIILNSIFWAGALAFFAGILFSFWRNKKTPETPAP